MTSEYMSNETYSNDTLNHTVLRSLINNHLLGHFELESAVAYVLVVLYIPLFLVGLLGNGILTLIIVSKRHLRNLTNLFLCNLALADLSVTVICIPVAVGQALYRLWIYGEFMCKLTGFLQGVTVAASVFTIALLSVDRYLAIRHPMLFRRLSTNAVALKLIVTVWILSVALMVPLFIVRQVDVMDIIPTEPVYFCKEHWSNEEQRQQYDLTQFVIIYVIPGCIICTCYGFIGTELWTENKDLKRTESATSQVMAKQMMKGRKRVAKMLIALAVLFAVCWLPYYCVSLYLDFYPQQTNLLVALPYTIFLGHSNSALNPVLYFYSSKSFRSVLIRMFKCRRRRFKPARQENMIVRCTRNNTTATTALTRRPLIRILSNSSKAQSRFSRSTNNSLKSTSGTNRTSFKSTTSTRISNKNNDTLNQIRLAKQKLEEQGNNVSMPNHGIKIIEHIVNDENNIHVNDKIGHRKEFMEATISIPSTINEESSRHNSLIPMVKMTPTPSMEAINEETLSGNSFNKKDDIELLTYALVTTSNITFSQTGIRESSDQETERIQIETYVT